MATKKRKPETLRERKAKEEKARQLEADRLQVSNWRTFAQMVESARFQNHGTAGAYVVEGLMRIGRQEDAQALAVELLCTVTEDQEHIRLALKKQWFIKSQYSGYAAPVHLLKLWAKNKRINSTWPPKK